MLKSDDTLALILLVLLVHNRTSLPLEIHILRILGFMYQRTL